MQLAHIVFFSLLDSTPEGRRKFVDLCQTHLSQHPGEVYFSVGTLADYKREVNDRDSHRRDSGRAVHLTPRA